MAADPIELDNRRLPLSALALKCLSLVLFPLSSADGAVQVRIVDLHASFREIWQGVEQWNSGKQAERNEHVTLDLDSPASGNATGIGFLPIASKGCNGPIIAAVSKKTSANQLELSPQTPLARGCSYEFVVPETARIARNGARLASPLRVRFRVNPSVLPPSMRELESVQRDPETGTLRLFIARTGIKSSIRRALERYQNEIGIPAADLRPSASDLPVANGLSGADQFYRQYHGAYEVSGFGYWISTRNGFFHSAHGKVVPKLPLFERPRLSETDALKRVAFELALTPPPWEVPGSDVQKPRGLLELIQSPSNTPSAPFVPVWGFDLARSGTAWSYIGIDVRTGKVVAKDTFHVSY